MEKKYTCTHCGQENLISGEEWELQYNSPILICPICKNEFLRDECKEIAISKVSFDDKLPVSLWAFGVILVGVVLLLCSFHFGSSVMIFRPKNLIFGLIAIVAGVAMAVSGVKNFKKKRTYLAEEKKRSMERCSDSNYTEKLFALGYKCK